MIKAVYATYIMLPQQPNLNIIERKFKRQILKPDPIILGETAIKHFAKVRRQLHLAPASVD